MRNESLTRLWTSPPHYGPKAAICVTLHTPGFSGCAPEGAGRGMSCTPNLPRPLARASSSGRGQRGMRDGHPRCTSRRTIGFSSSFPYAVSDDSSLRPVRCPCMYGTTPDRNVSRHYCQLGITKPSQPRNAPPEECMPGMNRFTGAT